MSHYGLAMAHPLEVVYILGNRGDHNALFKPSQYSIDAEACGDDGKSEVPESLTIRREPVSLAKFVS